MNDKLGQHFSLGYAEQIKNSFPGQSPYTIQMRSAVAFTRETDRMILDSIVQKAKENGITDLYVLNEDFILGAIREKMDRESKDADVEPVVHGTPMLRYRPERFERYEEYGLNDKGEMLYLKRVFVDEKNYAMYCPACGKRLCSRFKNFCPNCGAKMD